MQTSLQVQSMCKSRKQKQGLWYEKIINKTIAPSDKISKVKGGLLWEEMTVLDIAYWSCSTLRSQHYSFVVTSSQLVKSFQFMFFSSLTNLHEIGDWSCHSSELFPFSLNLSSLITLYLPLVIKLFRPYPFFLMIINNALMYPEQSTLLYKWSHWWQRLSWGFHA